MFQKLLYPIAKFEERNPFLIVAIFLILTVLFMDASSRITSDTNFENIVPKDIDSITALNEARDQLAVGGSSVVIMMVLEDGPSTDSVYDIRDPRVFVSLQEMLAKIVTMEDVIRVQSDLPVIEEQGKVVGTLEDIKGKLPTSTRLSEDYRLITASVTLRSGMSQEKILEVMDEFEDAVFDTPLPDGVVVKLAGQPALDAEQARSLSSNTQNVTLLGFAGVFVIIYILFRNLKLTLISVLPIIVAMIWTFGTLALLEIPISSVLTGVFSMIIGIGVDFGINILNRYNEEKKSNDTSQAIINAVVNLGDSIMLTSMLTIIGFLALLTATLPVMHDLAVALSFGIFYALVGAVAIIPSVLHILKGREK